MEIVRVDTFPTELGGRSEGSKHAPIINAIRDMKVGEIIRVGPFATAKEAENARTAANMCIRRGDGTETLHTRVRDVNGNKVRGGAAAYVFIKKVKVDPVPVREIDMPMMPKTYKIGEKVLTVHGTGHITRIDSGERNAEYRVDFDGDKPALWLTEQDFIEH